MSASSLQERQKPASIDERLAYRQPEANIIFDLIACLDAAPADWVIPWLKLIRQRMSEVGLGWRDIAFILKESVRKSVQNHPPRF